MFAAPAVSKTPNEHFLDSPPSLKLVRAKQAQYPELVAPAVAAALQVVALVVSKAL